MCNYFGLGDMIGSVCGAYKACKLSGKRLIVDTQLHPISRYLVQKPHEYSSLILENRDYVVLRQFATEEEINKHFGQQYVNIEYLSLWCSPFVWKDVSEDCKEFVRELMTYTIDIHSVFTRAPKTYDVLHIRLGDGDGEQSSVDYIVKYVSECLPHILTRTIILCDNVMLKSFIRSQFSNPNVIVADSKICHTGLASDLESLRDTLNDFHIACNASKITSLSVYHWVSGFVKAPSVIYDVPIVGLVKSPPFVPAARASS